MSSRGPPPSLAALEIAPFPRPSDGSIRPSASSRVESVLLSSVRKASITASWRLLCPPAKKRPTVRIVLRSLQGWPRLSIRPLSRRRDDADRRGRQPVVADEAVHVTPNKLRIDPNFAEIAEPVPVRLHLLDREPKRGTGVGRHCEVRRTQSGERWNYRESTANWHSDMSVSANGRGVATDPIEPEGRCDLSHPNGAVGMWGAEDDVVHSRTSS